MVITALDLASQVKPLPQADDSFGQAQYRYNKWHLRHKTCGYSIIVRACKVCCLTNDTENCSVFAEAIISRKNENSKMSPSKSIKHVAAASFSKSHCQCVGPSLSQGHVNVTKPGGATPKSLHLTKRLSTGQCPLRSTLHS